jgi:integrase/recombinase XerD
MLVIKEITSMKSQIIAEIETKMQSSLQPEQLEKLHEVLMQCLPCDKTPGDEDSAHETVKLFLAAKRVEGCSDKTVRYYDSTIRNVLSLINKDIRQITTDDLRMYLDNYQKKSGASKVTIDNIRRILSSFFSWLEDEDYISKSPVRRIHKVKTCKTVKETYTDEALELMRDNSECIRDLAIIDMLASTGMRVGELVRLDRADVDFENRECVVLGKGNKQRKVYFDARTKIHLQNYLGSREDEIGALFVSLQCPHERLLISGVEIRLRELGQKLGIHKVHPHKFRRTLATMAIDKGMPIEQVQQLLGHQSVDTTLQYAMVNQNNVKLSHHRFIG